MTNRGFVFLGAGLLVAGLFTPIVTLPIVGSVNLFNNGTNLVGVAILLLAVIAAIAATKSRVALVIWPAIAASGVLLYVFARLQYNLSELRATAAKELEGNPFAGLAQGAIGAIQLQWGWLVLAAGAGLLVYAAVNSRASDDGRIFSIEQTSGRIVAALSVLLLFAAPTWDIARGDVKVGGSSTTEASAEPTSSELTQSGDVAASDSGVGKEQAAYIRDNLRLYDLTAKYYDTYDGREPGVRFKIKNEGERTLDKVTVRVVFFDAAGKAIAEEEYNPVLVSEYNFMGDNSPLRPNYIWQMERDKFYVAKSVPSEWDAGKATATITDVEFAATP